MEKLFNIARRKKPKKKEFGTINDNNEGPSEMIFGTINEKEDQTIATENIDITVKEVGTINDDNEGPSEKEVGTINDDNEGPSENTVSNAGETKEGTGYEKVFDMLLEFEDNIHKSEESGENTCICIKKKSVKCETNQQNGPKLTYKTGRQNKDACTCFNDLVRELMTNLKDVPEKDLVYIFKTFVQVHVEVQVQDQSNEQKPAKISNLLLEKLQNLCITKGFSELARCTFQVNMTTDRLESYLKENFDTMSDKLTAVIISEMDKETVQTFFCEKDGRKKLEVIISKRHKALIKLLDKLVQQNEEFQSKIFEMDDEGKTPYDENYNFLYHTVFQKIAFKAIQDAVCHKAYHNLTKIKWEKWCKRAFTIDAVIYMFSVVLLTFVAATSANATHVVRYQFPIDYSRAIFEVILLLNAVRILGIEIYQVVRMKKDYLLDKMNIFEFVAPVLLLLVLPLRYLHEQAHWYIFAAAYLAWLLQIVKYALVFKSTGVYVDSLQKMILDDILKFAILFFISIIIFSGTFVLVLKAENTLEQHKETSSFWKIFIVGIRVMIESDNIIEYTGEDGYKFTGAAVMMVFMFFIIVVLLNMLVAQLLNTYQKIDTSSPKGYYVRRAMIVTRLEREKLPLMFNNDGKRKAYYQSVKIKKKCAALSDSGKMYEDPKTQLHHVGKCVRNMTKTLQNVNEKMDKLDASLRKVKDDILQMKRKEEDHHEQNILFNEYLKQNGRHLDGLGRRILTIEGTNVIHDYLKGQ